MKKTRVFLGNAPWSKRDYYGVRAGSRWPHFESEDMTYMPFPFFLAYATAVLENAGFPVMLVDGIAEGIVDKAFYDRIEDFKPDVILLEVSTNSWKKDEQHITHITQQFPQAKLFLAGLHDEMYQEAFLQQHPEVFGVLIGDRFFDLGRLWGAR